MQVNALFWINIISILAISGMLMNSTVFSQSQTNSTSNTTNSGAGSIVTVSSSVAIPVSNQTAKTNEGTLRSAVVNFLNSGPNILKTSDNYQLNTKTKIINQINNDTQNVEGVEATNAIVGVEIAKALKSSLSSSPQDRGKTITVSVSSTCKPTIASLVACDNAVAIK